MQHFRETTITERKPVLCCSLKGKTAGKVSAEITLACFYRAQADDIGGRVCEIANLSRRDRGRGNTDGKHMLILTLLT